MSKSSNQFRQILEAAKRHYTWQLAEAGNNLQWNLYQLRKAHGWTQRELGKRIGVKQPHIVRHEAWGAMPSMESLAKYAHVYGVTIADLLGEPMHFGPQSIFTWNDGQQEYVEIGTVMCESNAATITKEVVWNLP